MTYAEGMQLLLSEFPEFKPVWDELEKEWMREPRGATVDFGAFAGFVQQKYMKPHAAEQLDRVAALIERFIEEGDEDLSYGATVGFLEDVTNTSDPEVHVESLIRHLRPKSLEFCRQLERFWGSPIPGMDDQVSK